MNTSTIIIILMVIVGIAIAVRSLYKNDGHTCGSCKGCDHCKSCGK